MTNLSPLSSRSFLPTALPANQSADKNLRSDNAGLADKARNDLRIDPVSLSKNGLDLQQRVESLGNSTVDLAENLVGSFAQKLFGDAAKDATISFDSVSLETSSSYAAGVQHSESASGVSDAAAFSLNDSSHFLGKGTITTADGRKFDFEVEVQYDYALEASASKQSSIPAAGNGNGKGNESPRSAADPLPEIQFPDIHFPGSLQDLFRLFDKPLKSDVVQDSEQGPQKLGTLSLRLLNLVDNKAASDTYQPSENRAKALADAYGQSKPGPLPSTPGELAAAQVDALTNAAAEAPPAAAPTSAAPAAPVAVAAAEATAAAATPDAAEKTA